MLKVRSIAAAACLALIAPGASATESGSELATITNAANRGNAGAELLLGLGYLEGRYNLKPDPAQAFRWLLAAAQGDQPYAQYRVGQLYHDGVGVKKDRAEAARWWQRSAEQGNEAAQLALGEMALGRDGTKPDYRAAEHWLALAANQGNAEAQYQLGRMYRLGHGVPQDLQRGKSWLERAAARGHSDALKLLSFLADVGDETSEIHEQTGTELKRRAAGGDVEAQYQLALRYETGAWGVRRNNADAFKWFQAAADRGYPPAMRALAEVYEQGLLGVARDPARAQELRRRLSQTDGRGG